MEGDLQLVVSELSFVCHFHSKWCRNLDGTIILVVMKAHVHHHVTTFSSSIEKISSHQNDNPQSVS